MSSSVYSHHKAEEVERWRRRRESPGDLPVSAALSPPLRKNPRKNISALGAAKSEHPDLGTYDPEVCTSGN